MDDAVYMQKVLACERRLFRISRAILRSDQDCADAIQETVFKGWISRDKLREEQYFETWLIRILINECKNVLRRSAKAPVPVEEVRAEAISSPEENAELRLALDSLPEKYRLVLVLHHVEGYPLRAIARLLKLPESLVKSRLHQARSALKKALASMEVYES